MGIRHVNTYLLTENLIDLLTERFCGKRLDDVVAHPGLHGLKDRKSVV
jgi:hypothetical protein